MMLSEHKVRKDDVWKECGGKKTTQETKRDANMAYGRMEVGKAVGGAGKVQSY